MCGLEAMREIIYIEVGISGMHSMLRKSFNYMNMIVRNAIFNESKLSTFLDMLPLFIETFISQWIDNDRTVKRIRVVAGNSLELKLNCIDYSTTLIAAMYHWLRKQSNAAFARWLAH